LIFITQLTYEISEEFKRHLPVIFNLAILGMDYPHPLVHDNCRIILLNLIQSIVIAPLELVCTFQSMTYNESFICLFLFVIDIFFFIAQKTSDQKVVYEEAVHLAHFLKAKKGVRLWTNEAITLKKTEIRSTQELTDLVHSLVTIFASDKDLLENWASQGNVIHRPLRLNSLLHDFVDCSFCLRCFSREVDFSFYFLVDFHFSLSDVFSLDSVDVGITRSLNAYSQSFLSNLSRVVSHSHS
jgi:hypothetical protein